MRIPHRTLAIFHFLRHAAPVRPGPVSFPKLYINNYNRIHSIHSKANISTSTTTHLQVNPPAQQQPSLHLLDPHVLNSFMLAGKVDPNVRNLSDSVSPTSSSVPSSNPTNQLHKDNSEIIKSNANDDASGQPFIKSPIHYMNTLDVFNELQNAGFSDSQARKIIALTEQHLSQNLSRVVLNCVPKIDLENENYLFEAASSELRVEVKNSREQQLNELRSSLNLLDRELNSVTDELNDLMITCKNESEVAMNDHKSDSALLQKQLNIKIRELENRINSQLISELKFSVESLRWSLTRRGIFCILLVAASVLLAVTGNKVLNNNANWEPEITNTSTRDEFIRDNDEFPKDNDEYVQYEEWHEPKKIDSIVKR